MTKRAGAGSRLRYRRQQDRARWERASQAAAALGVDDPVVTQSLEALAAYVGRIWAESGAGPTWGEVARDLGWPYEQAQARIIKAAELGLLAYSRGPRSLRPAGAEEVATGPRRNPSLSRSRRQAISRGRRLDSLATAIAAEKARLRAAGVEPNTAAWQEALSPLRAALASAQEEHKTAKAVRPAGGS